MARADLYLQSIPQLFKQAAVSYKASIWVFLIIAILSSVYEIAIDHATDLSGFSLEFNDTSLSVNFDFRGKSLFPIHSDEKGNAVKQGRADSLLARFLSALFATTNGTAEELVQIKDFQAEKDGVVQTENQRFGLTEIGDQLADGIGGKIQQSNELEKTQNENPYESEGIVYVKPNEPETVEKSPNDSEYTHFEKIVQLKNPSENNDIDESGVTLSEKLNQLESDSDTARNISSNEPGSTHNKRSTELGKVSDGASDADGNAIEDGDEIIQPPVVGSLKMVHKFGNETKKSTGKKLHKQRSRTSSPAGIFGQGAMPPGTERTLVLVLSIILLVSFSILLVVTLQGAFVLRVVAFAVTSTHMSKNASVKQLLRSTSRSGIWKLMWFAILIWFLLELQTQLLAKILFGEVLEKDQIEKLVYRLSIMPFSVLAPWKDDLATGIGMFFRIGVFVSFEYLFDWLISSTYIMGCWVAIMEREYSGREALNRGWNLVKNMAFQAAIIKILEAFFCGRSFSWMLKNAGGQFFASVTVTLVQTYFLVVWLIFYFAARCKESEGERGSFSYQDLEDFLDKLR